MWVETTKPVQISCLTPYLVTTPNRITPFWRCTADLSIVGDHVITTIFTHTRKLWVWCELKMAQNDFSRQFWAGITEEKNIHLSFSQNQPRSLNLHTIEKMLNDTYSVTDDQRDHLALLHLN